MATSLAAQLQRLAVPQSTIYKDDNKTVSLLFDPKEAALKDRDTFYEIGSSGLSELIALNEAFLIYEGTLFSLSSKEFERAMENKEVNENLDKTIERFLLQLSPYILLQPAHKALEWLINRYHIHQYNQDAIMALILPYHSTKIFVRIVQLMDIKERTNRWSWLHPVQKNGTPLANQMMFNLCAQNNATMAFIAKSTLKYVEQYGEKANQLNTVFAFFCQSAIGMINSTKKIKESLINSLLPTIIAAIESPIADFRASAYIILGFLFTKTSFKVRTLNVIVDKLLTTSFDLSYDVTLLIIILCENQKNYVNMSETILNDMSIDIMNTLCGHLKVLIERKNNILSFVLAFLSSVLPQMQKDSEQFMRFSKLPEILIEEVDLKNQQPEKVIA